jgi:hypothetical protein
MNANFQNQVFALIVLVGGIVLTLKGQPHMGDMLIGAGLLGLNLSPTQPKENPK